MIDQEILKERERCVKIIKKKFKELRIYREQTIKNNLRRAESIFKRLQDDIFFLINNPNYRKGGKQ